MPDLRSLQRFFAENGIYTFATRIGGLPQHWLRNRILASTFGVHKLAIGPGAKIYGISAIKIGENFAAGPGLWLQAVMRENSQVFKPRILMGRDISISAWSHIAATNLIEIGDGVLIGSKVLITDHNHGRYNRADSLSSPLIPPIRRPLDSDRKVIIGPKVWLGDGVVVTPDSIIGEGAIIGANSVVRGTIPPFIVAAGVPARPIRQYDFETDQWKPLQITNQGH